MGYNLKISFIEAVKYLHRILGLEYRFTKKPQTIKKHVDPLEVFTKHRKRNWNDTSEIHVLDEEILNDYIPLLHIDWLKDGITERTRNMYNKKYHELMNDRFCKIMEGVANMNVNTEMIDVDVVKPSHYTDGNIEVIDFIEDKKLGFSLGNAIKYISRAGKKHDVSMTDKEKEIQDLEKAKWYLDRRITQLKKNK